MRNVSGNKRIKLASYVFIFFTVCSRFRLFFIINSEKSYISTRMLLYSESEKSLW